jgi:catalase
VWPEDRKTIELGMISITSVVPDSEAAQKALVFFPTSLTDGIELSDDPLPGSAVRGPTGCHSRGASNTSERAESRG